MSVNRACDGFRERLEALLEGRPDPPRLVELGWHEHLHACDECRELLAQEEALEALLASLPEPTLPPDLAARVLARLQARRDAALDDLLALDDVDVPQGLAARVRAATTAELDRRLDGALELCRDVEVPEGLAARVLEGLAAERVDRSTRDVARSRFRVLPGGGSNPAAWRLAAAVLVVLGGAVAWRALGTGGGARVQDHETDQRVADAPDRPTSRQETINQQTIDQQTINQKTGDATVSDDEIIAALPVLEYWDALQELDPLEQDIVTRLDMTDEALLDVEDS